ARRSSGSDSALLGFDLPAHALFQITQLWGEGIAEIVLREDLANLDLAVDTVGVRDALGPLNGLFERLQLPDPETGHQLLGFGKRAVGHYGITSGEVHPCTLRAG